LRGRDGLGRNREFEARMSGRGEWRMRQIEERRKEERSEGRKKVYSGIESKAGME